MGASLVYLEKPNKEIKWDKGENSNVKFVAAGMQGWRINMVRHIPPSRNESLDNLVNTVYLGGLSHRETELRG